MDYLPPQNMEAERGVIGCVLLDMEAIDDIPDLRPEHFYAERHRALFKTIRDLFDKGIRHIDSITLAEELNRLKILEEVGGVEAMVEIVHSVPNSAHAAYYAKIVVGRWKQRMLAYGCREIEEIIRCGTGEDDDAIIKAEKILSTIINQTVQSRSVVIRDVLGDVWSAIESRLKTERAAGVPTGFTGIDNTLIGLIGGELVVLAARPAMGKTAFVCSLSLDFINRGIGVFFVSLEMGKLEIGERLLCAEAGQSSDELKRGRLTGDALEVEMKQDSLMQSASRLMEKQFYIDDSGLQSVRQIAAEARRLKRTKGIGLLIIDYLQLIRSEGGKRDDTREREVANMTRELKGLAKELEIPVVLLAQLNRGVESRENKTPRLSDLRESGAIEQDADIVMFLHRPAAYDPADRPGECDVVIAKNRRGKIGTVTLAWLAESTRFADLEESPEWDSYQFPVNDNKTNQRDWDR